MDRQFRILLHEEGHADRNLKGVAHLMGMPYSTLAEQINPNSGKKFDCGELPGFIRATGGERTVQYLADQAGMVAYKLPDQDCGNSSVELAKSAKEFGELVEAYSTALANDGKLDAKERKRCRAEALDLIQAAFSFVASLDAD